MEFREQFNYCIAKRQRSIQKRDYPEFSNNLSLNKRWKIILFFYVGWYWHILVNEKCQGVFDQN